MVNIGILFQQVCLLVLFVFPAVLLKKFRLAGDGIGVGLSNITLYVASPAMIVNSFMMAYNKEILIHASVVTLFGILFHLLFFGVAVLAYPKNRTALPVNKVLRFAAVFTNAGYMGVPLIQAVVGQEATIYATFYIAVFNVFVWTLGCFIYTGDKSYISLKKAFINPATISVIIGLIIFVTPLGRLIAENPNFPAVYVVTRAVGSLNNLVAPLSMFVIGLRLAELDFRGFFRDKSLYGYLLLRMIAVPALCFGVLKLVALLGIYENEMVATVIFLCASTPAATATSMFAEKHDGDVYFAGKLVSLSTVLSVATMPLVSLLLKLY